MKCINIIVFLSVMYPYLSSANWCIQNTTKNVPTTRILTRIKTFRTWYGKQRQKIEAYRITEQVLKHYQRRVCCEGYTLNKRRRICEQNCPDGCPKFSDCLSPNNCKCQQGYEKQGQRCEPVCRSGCQNGKCIGPDQCVCDEDFLEEDGACIQDCQKTCKFGECLFGICKCWEGFWYNESRRSCQLDSNEGTSMFEMYTTEGNLELTEERTKLTTAEQAEIEKTVTTSILQSTTQIPTCEKGSCDCMEGFKFDESTRSCQFKTEVSSRFESYSTDEPEFNLELTEEMPNLTTGKQAEIEITATTSIVQSTTQIPTSEESCDCMEGFEYNKSTGSRKPSNEKESTDENEERYTINGEVFTSSREKSLQNNKKGISEVEEVVTTLIAESAETVTKTLESTSTSDTESTTDERHHEKDTLCWNNCDNGFCIADICQCNEGFVKANASCQPYCEDCEISLEKCIDENLCEGLQTELNVTPEVSTLSSIDDSSNNCSDGCWSGICIQDVCQCPLGLFFSRELNDCTLPCDKACTNGVCQDSGICNCLEGYIHKNSTVCIPECDPKCVNSICVAPRNCKCLHGFSHQKDNWFECNPMSKLSEKLERNENNSILFWIWGLVAIVIIAVLGMFVFQKLRKDTYNVAKNEKLRHIVQFDSKNEQFV